MTHTPSMGGIPIFLGSAFALLIWLPQEATDVYKYFFGALVITFVIGLRDDLIPLKPIYKLVSQMVPAIMAIYLVGDIQLVSLYELANWQWPQLLGVTVTLFVIIVITNSINLIDGIDGLAGSISFVSLGSLGIWFFLVDYNYLSFIIFSFLGSVLTFLYFNWQPSKIFMGDTGALVMGFLQACTIIIFINTNSQLPDTSLYKFNASVGTAICIMIIPLLDTLRVFVLRVVKAQSPFTADNNHIHHQLLKLGLDHRSSVLILLAVNVLYIITAVLMKDYQAILLLLVVSLLSVLLLSFLYLLMLKSQAKKTGV